MPSSIGQRMAQLPHTGGTVCEYGSIPAEALCRACLAFVEQKEQCT